MNFSNSKPKNFRFVYKLIEEKTIDIESLYELIHDLYSDNKLSINHLESLTYEIQLSELEMKNQID